MQIKEMICTTLRLAGRDDVADELSSGDEQSLSAEAKRLKASVFTYLNAVTQELARCYFTLEKSQVVNSVNGKFTFASLEKSPSKILRVKDAVTGKSVPFKSADGCITANAERVRIDYCYTPAAFNSVEQEFAFPRPEVTERMVECGAVAEFFLVMGDATGAAAWEEKYHDEIELMRKRYPHLNKNVPPRRWV